MDKEKSSVDVAELLKRQAAILAEINESDYQHPDLDNDDVVLIRENAEQIRKIYMMLINSKAG